MTCERNKAGVLTKDEMSEALKRERERVSKSERERVRERDSAVQIL